MTVAITNLSDTLYDDSRLKLNKSAQRHGVEYINSYRFEDLKSSDFFLANAEILLNPKGLGYWLWKPYIILKTFEELSDDDIVIYADCGIEIIDDLSPLIKICEDKEPILLFGNSNFKNACWTKRDCFVLMDCDREEYWNALHADAAFSIFKKCDSSIHFLKEWLKYGSNKHIITDLPNIGGKNNLSEFIAHRWDQSILSLLAQKYKIDFYRMPTQFGNHYKINSLRKVKEFNCINQIDQQQLDWYAGIPYHNSPYPQLLDHHRQKNTIAPVFIRNDENKNVTKLKKTSFVIQKSKAFISKIYKLLNRNAANFKTSYSQCGEDLIIDYVFTLRGIHQPSYIDIGANHPYHLSNTALFYAKGCKGINIEANPFLITEFEKQRKKDVNINIGIGPEGGEGSFYIIDDHTLSTFSEKEANNVAALGRHKIKEIRKISLTTIESILTKYCNGLFPDFLSIDVEGLDLEVLQSIDFDKHAPKIICVEAAEYSAIGAGARRSDLIDFLISKNYFEYANTNLNAIMVRRDFWFV